MAQFSGGMPKENTEAAEAPAPKEVVWVPKMTAE